jgi:hypothetical protein
MGNEVDDNQVKESHWCQLAEVWPRCGDNLVI